MEGLNNKVKVTFRRSYGLRTFNDGDDFGIGRRLCNLPALREIGFSANRRLLDAQRLGHDPVIGEQVFGEIAQPIVIDGQRAPALRFGDPRVHALLAAIVIYRLQPQGFTNRQLRVHLAELLGIPPEHFGAGRMTYHLRRLRLHGIIERIPGTHRYQLTNYGWKVALFFTRAYNRFLRTGLAEITDSSSQGSLAQAFARLARELDRHANRSGIAA